MENLLLAINYITQLSSLRLIRYLVIEVGSGRSSGFIYVFKKNPR